MSGRRGGFSDAVARFTAEVSDAVTNARRAAGEAREKSATFRRDTEELRAKSAAPVRRAPASERPPEPEDEDFSQHRFLDNDARPVPRESAEDTAADSTEPAEAMTDPVAEPGPEDPHTSDDEDFSQQRILVDSNPRTYRHEALGAIDFEPPDSEKPS